MVGLARSSGFPSKPRSGYPFFMTSRGPEELEAIVRAVVYRYAQEVERLKSAPDSPLEALFYSPLAESLKREILAVGKKLWLREFVDGNGGNISCRLTDDLVLCTPTMRSKYDLTLADISLVDLDNNRVCGSVPHTSEIRLHLTIYRHSPEARAVVHCHPPHATAYSITGLQPPQGILPEQEVFVGVAPVSPYDTPGTQAFGETVIPFVKDHNTILLANHGIVCWADTITHAEWQAEVLDTYCRTLILASQLGRPITTIPEHKLAELLRIKRSLGIPDPRHERSNTPPAVTAKSTEACGAGCHPTGDERIEKLAARIAAEVLAGMKTGD